MAYRLVILDFDGTIADTRAAVTACMMATLSDVLGGGHSVSEAQIAAVISSGATLPAAIKRLIEMAHMQQQCDAGSLAAAYRERYQAEAPALTRLYPGVAEVLQDASDAGIRCVVMSNKGEKALHDALSDLGISHFFDSIIGEQPALPPKPEASIFEKIIFPRYATLTRSDILMVGDTLADLQFAENSGIDGCWAQYGYGDKQGCQAASPNFEISTFHGLKKILNSLASHSR